MSDRLRVVFVDDEPRILDGLRRQLRGLREQWDMRFAGSGDEALVALEREPADVLVTDMRMPAMSGAELLRVVQGRWPATIRIVLSGQTDHEALIEDLGPIHQFLQKPCEPQVLHAAIHRAIELTRVLRCPKLRQTAAYMSSIPVMSRSHQQLLSSLNDEDVDLSRIALLISQDVGLTAKLLQLVNSAFFGMPHRVDDAATALKFLGVATVRSLVITARVFDHACTQSADQHALERISDESVRLAMRAANRARAAGADERTILRTQLAGTLSQVGRLVLISAEPQRCQAVLERSRGDGVPLEDAELAEFGAAHSDIGAYLLGLWGFHEEVIEAVAFHVSPGDMRRSEERQRPLTFLHQAYVETVGEMESRDASRSSPSSSSSASPAASQRRDAA